MNIAITTLAAAIAALTGAASAWAEPQVLHYEIRKDGEAIGSEIVRIDSQGTDLVVDVENHSRATVLFMDFVFDQRRHEEWRGAALRKMTSRTNDDGTVTQLEVRHGADGWAITVNGAGVNRPVDALPASLWTDKVVGTSSLFGTIDATAYAVQVTNLGQENLPLGGRMLSAAHYRLSGDLERELWYGADGTLLKTSFKRKGFPIEFVLVAP